MVYNDLDNNGAFDIGEVGVADWTLLQQKMEISIMLLQRIRWKLFFRRPCSGKLRSFCTRTRWIVQTQPADNEDTVEMTSDWLQTQIWYVSIAQHISGMVYNDANENGTLIMAKLH